MTCPDIELDTTLIHIDLGNKGEEWHFPDGTPLSCNLMCSYEITSIEYPKGKVWGYISVPKWLFDIEVRQEFEEHGFKFKDE